MFSVRRLQDGGYQAARAGYRLHRPMDASDREPSPNRGNRQRIFTAPGRTRFRGYDGKTMSGHGDAAIDCFTGWPCPARPADFVRRGVLGGCLTKGYSLRCCLQRACFCRAYPLAVSEAWVDAMSHGLCFFGRFAIQFLSTTTVLVARFLAGRVHAADPSVQRFCRLLLPVSVWRSGKGNDRLCRGFGDMPGAFMVPSSFLRRGSVLLAEAQCRQDVGRLSCAAATHRAASRAICA